MTFKEALRRGYASRVIATDEKRQPVRLTGYNIAAVPDVGGRFSELSPWDCALTVSRDRHFRPVKGAARMDEACSEQNVFKRGVHGGTPSVHLHEAGKTSPCDDALCGFVEYVSIGTPNVGGKPGQTVRRSGRKFSWARRVRPWGHRWHSQSALASKAV